MIVRYQSIIGKIVHVFGYYGITFGDVVYTAYSSLTEEQMKHEYCHTLQYKRYGWIGFLTRYLWYQMTYGYMKNPLEIEADEYVKSGPHLASIAV